MGNFDPVAAYDTPLNFGGFTVHDGSHVTHLSLETPEALEVGSSYALEGLKKGETVLLVALAQGHNHSELIKRRGYDGNLLRPAGPGSIQ